MFGAGTSLDLASTASSDTGAFYGAPINIGASGGASLSTPVIIAIAAAVVLLLVMRR